MKNIVSNNPATKANTKPFFFLENVLRSIVVIMVMILSGNHLALAQNANITISTGATSGGTWSGGVFTPNANTANIQNTDLQTRLASSNVTINTACGACNQAGTVTTSATITYNGTTQRTFTINAANNITIGSTINLAGPSGGTNGYRGGIINFTSNAGSVAINNTLTTNGAAASAVSYGAGGAAGSVTISGTSVSMTVGSGISAVGGLGRGNGGAGGAVSITATQSTISITKAITTTGGNSGVASPGTSGAGGAVTLTGPGGLSLAGAISNLGGSTSIVGTPGLLTINNGNATVTSGGGVNDGQTAGTWNVGRLTKTGTGTLRLGVNNTITGTAASTVTVSAGTLRYGINGALGNTAGSIVVASVAAIDLNGFSATSKPLTLNGTGVSNSGALFNSSTTAGTFAGLITLGSATTITAGSGTINISNAGTIAGAGFRLTLDGDAGGTLGSILGNTTGGLTIGGGTWTISKANTYTGTTIITGGTLKLGATGVIADGTSMRMDGGSTLSTFNNTTRETLGTLQLNTGISTISLAATGGLNFAASNAVTWNGDTLYITGWTSTGAKIFFGSASTGLTLTQLSKIKFVNAGSEYEAILLSTGELVPAATIITAGTLASLSSCAGIASSNTSFSVSASGITDANILVSAPSGFEVSTSTTSGFASSINLPVSSGTLSTTTIYVRMPSSNTAGSYSGNVTVSGNPASSKTVATASSTVNAVPTITATTPANLCGTGTVTLEATASAGTINWYEAATGGSILSTGTSFTIPSLSTTTTYYVDATFNGCTTATRTAVTATISPTSIGGTATAALSTVCSGNSSTVSISGHEGTIQWQQSADGSTAWANVSGGSGANTATYTRPNLTATTYYRAVVTSGACTSAISTSATVTVNTSPTVTFTAQPGAAACASTDVTYTTQSDQSNYLWTVPGVLNTDYSITSGGVGTSSNTVTLKWLTAGDKTVTVNYTNASGCSAPSVTSSTATTISNSAPTVSVTASSICVGSNITASSSWTPAALGNSLAMWLDAADALTIIQSGGAVSQWSDKSGNGRHALPATVANQPTTGLVTLNGRNTIDFDGSTDRMDIDNLAVNNLHTIYAVGYTVNSSGYRDLLRGKIVNEDLHFGQSGGNFSTFYGNNTTWADISSNTPSGTSTSASIFGVVANGAGIATPYHNGTAQSNKNCTMAGTTTGFSIGSVAGNNFWDGPLAEIVVAPTALSTDDRQKLEGYLAHKWGLTANLPLGHPYRGTSPTFSGTWTSSNPAVATIDNSGVITGVSAGTATFTFTTTGGCSSTTGAIEVFPAVVGGSIAGSATVCSTGNSTTLTLSGHTGNVVRWESSLDNFATAGTTIANTTATLTATNVTATTSYRAVVQSGSCGTANSAIATITFEETPTVSLTESSVCVGDNITAGSGWSPTALGTSLALWLDAADTSTIIKSDVLVSQWDDKSGNSKHVKQSIEASKPSYTSGVMSFGLGKFLKTDAGISDIGSNATLISVIQSRKTSTYVAFSSSGNPWGWAADGSGGVWNSSGSPTHYHNGTSIAWTNTTIGGILGINTNIVVAKGVNFSGWTSTFRLAAFPEASTYNSDADYKEVILLSSSISDSDREKIEGYLAHKWGLAANLPIAHPYKSVPPSITGTWTSSNPAVATIDNSGVITGVSAGTATFTFTATGGCSATTDLVTVTPLATLGVASSSPTVCVNTPMVDVTHATTGVTGIASSTGLPAGVTASYASNTLTISGTPTESGTFNYTITPEGCGTATATGTITVNACIDTDGDGVIDDLDIDDDNDGVLDADEELGLNNDCAPRFIDSEPMAYWPLDNSTNDTSGNSYNAITANMPGFSTTAIQGTHSAQFNGTTNYIQFSQDGGFMETETSKISFSAWIMPSNLAGQRVIYEEGGTTNGFMLWLDNGTPTVTTRNMGSEISVASSTTLKIDNKWHHIATVFDNGVISIYVDGRINSIDNSSNFNIIPVHTDNGGIGGPISVSPNGITGFYAGLIDVVRYSSTEAWDAIKIQYEAQILCNNHDIDNDGIINRLDIDSDGDGCSDGVEAGNTESANNNIVNYNTGTDTNQNGLLDQFENGSTGSINYTSTYSQNALDDSYSACNPIDFNTDSTDSDNDGKDDSSDLDDDNDGILDIDENPCLSVSPPSNVAPTNTQSVGFSISPTSWTVLTSSPDVSNTEAWGGNIDYKWVNEPVNSSPNNHDRWISGYRDERIGTTLNNLVPSTQYSITLYTGNFDVDRNDYNRSPEILVQLDNATIATITKATPIATTWETHVISFTATGTSAVLSFINGSSYRNSNASSSNPGYVWNISVSSDAVACSAQDTDLDGIPDYLDLDSDGDGCSDSVEAGNTTIANGSTTVYNTGTDANNNGLLDQFENGTTGTINYTSTYTTYALDDTLNGCLDTDGDGIGDLIDIDDDNDGVLDIFEKSCFSFSSLGAPNGHGITLTGSGNLLSSGGTSLYKNLIDTSYTAIISKTMTELGLNDEYDIVVSGIGSTTGINPAETLLLRIELGSTVLYEDSLGNFFLANGNYGNLSFSGIASENSPVFRITLIKTDNTFNIDPIITSFEFNFCGDGVANSVDLDTDNDGIPNRLDLDSDGDGCSDGVEAGNTAIANNNTSVYNTGTDANNNGLLDQFENGTTGTINYTSTYTAYALNSNINACTDTDGDGIGDAVDLDDDNDGVLDIFEKSCFSFSSLGAPNGHGITLTGSGTLLSSGGAFLYNNWIDTSYTAIIFKTMTELDLNDEYDITVSGIGSTTGINPAEPLVLRIELGSTVLYENSLGNFFLANGNYGNLSFSGIALENSPVFRITLIKTDNTFNIDPIITSFEFNFCGDGVANSVDLDDDNDNIPNRLDLDSDGDGCSDGVEAGNTSIANGSTTVFNTGTDANNNGLLDQFENGTTGTINYSSTYTTYALDDMLNACFDTDGDGVIDDLDIDDDNDGILDTNEGTDTDNDGIINSLDLDSDGDGCSDSVEAGNTTIANNNTSVYNTGTDANNNGLLDQFENGTTGTINYTSTYIAYALNDAVNACTDTDGDGLFDGIQLTGFDNQRGIGTSLPDPSAILDLTANGSRVGLVIPRLTTTERDTSLKSPTAGLLIYNTTTNTIEIANSSSQWVNILTGLTSPVTIGTTNTTGGLGLGTISPDANAVLDIYSTTKGVLLSKSATDPTGVAGMMYYNTTEHAVKLYNGTNWIVLTN